MKSYYEDEFHRELIVLVHFYSTYIQGKNVVSIFQQWGTVENDAKAERQNCSRDLEETNLTGLKRLYGMVYTPWCKKSRWEPDSRVPSMPNQILTLP